MNTKNAFVGPLLTDLYQLTMAHAYWKAHRHEEPAAFDLFFRQNPFGGEFTIFAGLAEVVRFVEGFRFTDDEIDFVRSVVPGCDKRFYEWLREVDCSKVVIRSLKEGTVVFPRIPMLTVEGPLAITQLLETTLLNLVGYASLVATNAARFRMAAGKDKALIEFGLRRAQGPDGGVSASRYSYMGGFDATSNVLAGQIFGIPVRGTHAHSFVSAFSGTTMADIEDRTITGPDGVEHDFVDLVAECREKLGFTNANEGELAAFIAYAQAFPKGFLALVDTYDTLKSGVPNFLSVALALQQIGYRPLGVRLDSGDLAYLSKEVRRLFGIAGARHSADFARLSIVASNDINEATLLALNQQEHEIDIFGIGTHLVTCQAQPALGCVYKLVEVSGEPRIKLSQDVGKVTIPGRKEAYRLIGVGGSPLLDLLIQVGEEKPQPGMRILCRHPFDETKRVFVAPTRVVPLHHCAWDGSRFELATIDEVRTYVSEQLASMREDHLRPFNPTPYKVSVTDTLYKFIHGLWLQEVPIAEMR